MHTLSHSLVQTQKNIYSYAKYCHKIPNQELSGRMLELEVTCSFLKSKKQQQKTTKQFLQQEQNGPLFILSYSKEKKKKASKRDLAAVN